MATETVGQQFILFTGPLFIGIILNWALFGAVAIQTFLYFSYEFEDALWLKGLVILTIGLDTLQSVFTTHTVWHMVIANWGDPASLLLPPWTGFTLPIMGGIVALLVQSFCAWRIYMFAKTPLAGAISILIVTIALMQCGSAIGSGVQWAILGVVRASQLKAASIVWLVGSSTCDVIIAVSLSYILYSAKRAYATFSKTNTMIDKLISQVIQSGAITAVFAITQMILFLVDSEKYLHICISLFLGKLYSNVLLANLNSRRRATATIFTGATDYSQANTLNNVHITTTTLRQGSEVELKSTSRSASEMNMKPQVEV